MPAVIPAAAALGASYYVGTALAYGAVWGAFAGFAASYLTGQLLGNEAGGQDDGGFKAEARGRQVVVRSAVEPRRIVYGQPVVSARDFLATHE